MEEELERERLRHSKCCLEHIERELARIEAQLSEEDFRLLPIYFECKDKLTREIERLEEEINGKHE